MTDVVLVVLTVAVLSRFDLIIYFFYRLLK